MTRWLFSRNVRVRLTLWYVLIFGIVLVAFSAGIVLLLQRNLESGLDDSVSQRADTLIATTSLQSGRPVLPESVVRAASIEEFDDDDDDPLDEQDDEPFARTYDVNGILVSNAGAHPNLPSTPEIISSAMNGRDRWTTIGTGEESFRVLARPVVSDGEVVGVLEVGLSREDVIEAIDALMNILLVAIPLTLLLAMLGGWFLARRALAPVDNMTSVARRISAEDLSQRLNMELPDDEFGRLARTLDDMIDRLDTAFRQQRQFTADASHELRTPLTALKGHTEITLERNRTPDEYRSALARVDSEVDRLVGLVQRLLMLARADAGRIPLDRENVMVSRMVDAGVEQLSPQASRRGVVLKIERGPEVDVSVDESLMLQLLLNLIDNALHHTPGGGTVTLRWYVNQGSLVIEVHDNGDGIPPEHLPHIFERFYRVDSARDRRSGSTGLGLSICQWIVEAHGGTIEAMSAPSSGTTFRITFPERAVTLKESSPF